MMTNSDRIVEYLRKIAPRNATNSQISNATGIRPHAQVFQITSKLEKAGRIKGRLFGKEWEYWIDNSLAHGTASMQTTKDDDTASSTNSSHSKSHEFEKGARLAMERHYGAKLEAGQIAGIPKKFDFCSPDKTIVGDAKFFSMVGGDKYPPAKMSVISEYVWLLSHTGARKKFMIFGNDQRVIELWLQKHRHLAPGIEFFFLSEEWDLVSL